MHLYYWLMTNSNHFQWLGAYTEYTYFLQIFFSAFFLLKMEFPDLFFIAAMVWIFQFCPPKCVLNLVWSAKTSVLDLEKFGIINYLKQVVHFVPTICSMACIAVYMKPEFLIYSNLNCDLKMNVDHMPTMVLKHLLQVVQGLLVIKPLGPCCLFLKRVNPVWLAKTSA